MRKNKVDKFMEKALNKMFQAVGFEGWDREFTDNNKDWYSQRTWTRAQAEEFKDWFLKEIKKDLKLHKTSAQKEWSWFYLMWGWREQG